MIAGMGGERPNGVFGRRGPRRPRLANLGARAALPAFRLLVSHRGLIDLGSPPARARLSALERAITAGREAYVLGVGVGFHNSGAALVRVSTDGAVELICNEEEERYTGVKHCSDYPEHSVAAVKQRMDELGIGPEDLAACVSSWDYAKAAIAFGIRPAFEEAPASFSKRLRENSEMVVSADFPRLLKTSADRLSRQLGGEGRMPIVGIRHHDNHAYFSYAVSPFAADPGSTMVIVLDGSGDDASTSLYVARDGEMELLSARGSNTLDSLGTLYAFLSSTQGGWPMLSSEGRFMGAAAWGDGDRLTIATTAGSGRSCTSVPTGKLPSTAPWPTGRAPVSPSPTPRN